MYIFEGYLYLAFILNDALHMYKCKMLTCAARMKLCNVFKNSYFFSYLKNVTNMVLKNSYPINSRIRCVLSTNTILYFLIIFRQSTYRLSFL